MTVPLVVDEATVARWQEADTGGSADAAYAIGLLLSQRGDAPGAMTAWRRGDARGSAEAAYLFGVALWGGGQKEQAEQAWLRGTDRGSAAAAYSIAALAKARGDGDVEVGRLVDHALTLARASDEQGSADGACVAAQLLAWKQEQRASEAAWRRAAERGSAVASCVMASLAYERGDLTEAEAAAARADERGLAAGALVHGNTLDARGDHAGAVAAWRRARRLAAAQGDGMTRVAAQRALYPSGMAWLRAHRGRTFLIIIGLMAIGALLSVAAAVAVLLALAAVYAWHRPLLPGSPVDVTRVDSGYGIDVGGLSVSGEVGAPLEPDFQTMALRPASLRDTAYSRIWPALLGAGALVFAAWAADVIDGDAVLRSGLLVYALAIVWRLAWVAPAVLRGRSPDAEEAARPTQGRDDSAALDVGVPTPVPFVTWKFHVAIAEPRLMPLVEWVSARRRANADPDSWARRARGALILAGWLLVAVFFAALAVAPDRADVARAARDTVGTLVAMSALAVSAGLCLVHATRALRDHEVRALASSLSYLLATAAVLAVAWWLGFLDGWLAVLRSIP